MTHLLRALDWVLVASMTLSVVGLLALRARSKVGAPTDDREGRYKGLYWFVVAGVFIPEGFPPAIRLYVKVAALVSAIALGVGVVRAWRRGGAPADPKGA